MLTRNWYKALSTSLESTTLATIKRADGSTHNIDRSYGFFRAETSNSWYCCLGKIKEELKSYGGILFGTGTTPPTIDDYTISGEIITGLAATVAYDTSYDDTGRTMKATYTITNNNDNAVTIGEIAAFSGSGNSSGYSILLDRTVLDSPVTIEPGGVGQVTYTIEFKYPTA